MPATVQLNTRIDPELKRSGDAVFARAGLTPSEVVRAVWAHAARTQSVPECVLDETGAAADEASRKVAAIHAGSRVAFDCAASLGFSLAGTNAPYEQLRDEMYSDMMEQIDAQLA